MLSDKLQDAINEQINAEYHSGYLYLAMAAYFETLNLAGSSHWMRLQAQEEVLHGMKLFDYLLERGGQIKLTEVAAPPDAWNSPLTAFEEALKHEQYMTQRINGLAKLALDENDFATNNVMQWYVTEQVEEESNVDGIVQQLKLVGENGPGIFMIDRELLQRTVAADPGATA